MSNGKDIKSKKSTLQEAKANFEEIKRFAKQNAKKELEAELSKKVDILLKESISINVDNDGRDDVIINDKIVSELDEVNHGAIQSYGTHVNAGGETVTGKNNEEELDEMITLEQEDQITPEVAPEVTPEVAPEVTPEVAPEVPTSEFDADVSEDSNIETIAQDLTQNLIDLVKATSGEESAEVNVIDDEETIEPAPEVAPTPEIAPEAAPAPAPLAEDDELLEFTLDEIGEKENAEDNDEMIFEFEDETFEFNPDSEFNATGADMDIKAAGENWKDDVDASEFDLPEINEEDETFEFNPDSEFDTTGAATDIKDAGVNWKDDVDASEFDLPEINEEEITEMLSKAKTITQGQNTLSRVPRLEENKNNKNKVHNESKTDELLKENARLKTESNAMSNVIKEYKSSFTDLRKQFDDLQTFNARLAYANSIFANGGFTSSEKVQIAERFDKTKTVSESKALFDTIIKESKISVKNNNFGKIKSTATKTAKPVESKKPLYESTEMKRNKVLAGIRKAED